MEVTERSVKDFLLPETKFQEAAETPERSGINFQASLKFFQEQFIANESNFQPSPFQSNREENLNPERKSEFRSLPIEIPTVDTILESVRVLRAIQKSEQERCPTFKQTSEEETHRNSENKLCSFWPRTSLGNENNLSIVKKPLKDSETKENKTESRNEEKGQSNFLQEGLDLVHPHTNSLEIIEEFTTNLEQYDNEDNAIDDNEVEKRELKNDTSLVDVSNSLESDLILDESLGKDNSANIVTCGKKQNQIPKNSTEVNSKKCLFESNTLDIFFHSSLELYTVLGDKGKDSNDTSGLQEKYNSEVYLDEKEKMKELNDDEGESSLTAKHSSTHLLSIAESLYSLDENPEYQVMKAVEKKFEETLYVLSKGTFCEYPEDYYVIVIEDSVLKISKNFHVLVSLNMKYGKVSVLKGSILEIDNRMGKWVHLQCDNDAKNLKNEIESHCLKHWQTDCIQLVHYPLKSLQNVVIIDLGSCSTRAGILMDEPTLPSLFFPTICAADKQTGTCVYGMDALKPEVRRNSVILFPVRPSNKITKHTIDIDLLGGLFKKIFHDLKVNPAEYIVQICLPRSLSLNTQIALVKLVLEDLQAKAVCLTSQALLTLYAHDVKTAIAVNIGERLDILPVVDGFIVEKGVTRFPHGGQTLIHHMNQSLAEKRITLSNGIDSFVVQYILKNLSYVAEDYNSEMEKASRYQNMIQKTITLQSTLSSCKSIALEEARFKVPEGLFNPSLWGLDSPGIHHLVQKAITATNVDARKTIAENIYVSGGVTMLPGFAERLNKELAKLNKPKIAPKVTASNYRYHCPFLGACKLAKLEAFPQVCVNLEEYSQNGPLALKKWALF